MDLASEFGQGGLWKEIVESKYGPQTNNSKVSLWWRDLMKVRWSVEWEGKFVDRFNWEIENWRNIMFLPDN